MNRFNKTYRSRSKERERYNDDYFYRDKYENINNIMEGKNYKRRELELERRLENINEEKRLKEKERESEKRIKSFKKAK